MTVVPITSTVRGLRSEVAVRPRNGLEHDCVANLDSIVTISRDSLLCYVGALLDGDERDLTRAFHEALDLED